MEMEAERKTLRTAIRRSTEISTHVNLHVVLSRDDGSNYRFRFYVSLFFILTADIVAEVTLQCLTLGTGAQEPSSLTFSLFPFCQIA